jgi:hypothetical protein
MKAFNQAWNVLKKESNPNYLYHENIPPYHPTSHQGIPFSPYSGQEKENRERMMDKYMERMKQNAPYGQGNPSDNNLPYSPYQPQPKPFEPKRNPFEHERPPYQQDNPQYQN